MKIGFLQTTPEFGDKGANLERVAALLEGLSADLVVLPELFSTGYVFTDTAELAALAEPFPGGPTAEFLAGLARERNAALVAGVLEREGARYFNSAVAFGPEGHLATYRKTHLFRMEKRWFAPGDTGFRVFRFRGVSVGMMICFDWIFPEAARALALAGAQVICHPSNLVLPHCQKATVTRCLENRVFIVTANRAGVEDRGGTRMVFTGGSQVTAPSGEVLAHAPEEGESLGVVEIDPADALRKNITPENDLFRDRRPNCYRILTDASQ
jgi:predicted amidohydrolase